MIIENSTIDDIGDIFNLYELATQYQKILFPDNLWPEFERQMIMDEIINCHQWKLVIENEVACIWATTFSDPKIWEEKDIDPSIYIHRIATHPKFRGYNFVGKIVTWAKGFALQHGKDYIRLDTCGNNKKLITHYTRNGFEFLGMWKLKAPDGLPAHYIGADVCFFEINL